MENGFYLITGTSRGIGEALARKVLSEGSTVLGVSRKSSGYQGGRGILLVRLPP